MHNRAWCRPAYDCGNHLGISPGIPPSHSGRTLLLSSKDLDHLRGSRAIADVLVTAE